MGQGRRMRVSDPSSLPYEWKFGGCSLLYSMQFLLDPEPSMETNSSFPLIGRQLAQIGVKKAEDPRKYRHHSSRRQLNGQADRDVFQVRHEGDPTISCVSN